MNADLTFNSVVFKKSWDDADKGSYRQSIARALNEPDVLTIRSTPYVDSKTKVPGTMRTFRVDRVEIDANLQPINQSISCTLRVPQTALQADIDTLVATFKAIVADANFITNVLNNEQ